jgi:hypothetical protein
VPAPANHLYGVAFQIVGAHLEACHMPCAWAGLYAALSEAVSAIYPSLVLVYQFLVRYTPAIRCWAQPEGLAMKCPCVQARRHVDWGVRH